jgi:hypothetical protein
VLRLPQPHDATADPGEQPTQNDYVERSIGKFRDKRLNEHGCSSLAEARQIIGAWRTDDNPRRALVAPAFLDERGGLKAGALRGEGVRYPKQPPVPTP